MFTWTFWKRALERAIKTAGQALLGVLVGGTLFTIDWRAQGAVIITAVASSIAMSLAGTKIGDNSADPSWNSTTEEDKDVDQASTKNN